ncbi:hypothetical protein F7725_019216 [Dissostichus mawsoni]|uniref:Uncharacterized protein n=1 Tax=Dissostichus mawsoni TaxID=36200 RepID=A0A7J5YM56_DISMA|nr:hypothetical protein F7725_019216 [Dissostichus mawsoni]
MDPHSPLPRSQGWSEQLRLFPYIPTLTNKHTHNTHPQTPRPNRPMRTNSRIYHQRQPRTPSSSSQFPWTTLIPTLTQTRTQWPAHSPFLPRWFPIPHLLDLQPHLIL